MTPAILYAAVGLLKDAVSLLMKGSKAALPHMREDAAVRARVKIREAFAILGGDL